MLRQNFANDAAIDAMRDAMKTDGTPYYWVNVGVVKYFTQDLTEAAAYYNSVGDSLYRADGRGFGEEILRTFDGPESYRVELELFPLPGIDDADLPENWVSGQVDQMAADRIASNCLSFEGITGAYPPGDLINNVGRVVVRIIRAGAGTVEMHEAHWPDVVEMHRARSLNVIPVADDLNNVGRMCTVLGVSFHRPIVETRQVWRIEKPLQDMKTGARHYFVRHTENGQGFVVSLDEMTNVH